MGRLRLNKEYIISINLHSYSNYDFFVKCNIGNSVKENHETGQWVILIKAREKGINLTNLSLKDVDSEQGFKGLTISTCLMQTIEISMRYFEDQADSKFEKKFEFN